MVLLPIRNHCMFRLLPSGGCLRDPVLEWKIFAVENRLKLRCLH
jgi:hypothetical protein